MNLRSLAAAAAAAVSFAFVVPAGAVSLSATGNATLGTLPGSFGFNVLGVAGGSPVYYETADGSGLQIDGAAHLKYTFMGYEAGFSNTFVTSGSTVFQNHSSPTGASAWDSIGGAGLLAFSFLSNGFDPLANGGANPGHGGIAFVLLSATEALLFFNDNWGGDADYNDMIVDVKISDWSDAKVSPVPVPAALPLFAAGLAGLGALGRRRKRIAQP